jgi:hypothetical protein
MIRRTTSVSATRPWTRCFIARGAAEVSGSAGSTDRFGLVGVALAMCAPGVADRGYDPGMRLGDEVHPGLGLGDFVCRHAPSGSTGHWPGTWSLGREAVVGRREVCLRAGPLRASGFDRFDGVLGVGSVAKVLVALLNWPHATQTPGGGEPRSWRPCEDAPARVRAHRRGV